MTKKLRKKIPAVLMILLAVLFIPGIADAKEYQSDLWNFEQTIAKTSGAFTFYAYPSKNQKEAWIYKIKIRRGNSSKLSIPSELDHKKVTRLGSREWFYLKEYEDELPNIFGVTAEPWHKIVGYSKQTKRIKKLVLPNTVRVIQPTAFSGMTSIKTVKIPKNVKTLSEYTFYGCSNLKSVELPAGLKTLDTLAFWECPKLTEMKLSSKNKTYQVKDKCVITKKKKELIYAMAGGQTFQVPEGVEIIKQFSFSNCTSPTINISASVKKIEKYAFMNPSSDMDKPNIKNVTVDPQNSVYAKDGQCIYNKTDKSLSVAIPDEKGALYISEQVEKLTEEKSIVGMDMFHFTKVVYPESLKTVAYRGFEDLTYADTIYFKGKNPPDCIKENGNKHDRPPRSGHIYVPEGSKEVYKQWYLKYKHRWEDDFNPNIETFQPDDEI